ncbi:MAG: hypothetical protein ABII74_04780 [Elusimicrobiota bacterium]
MKILKLKPVKITAEILSFLEKRDLIKTLTPTKKTLKVKEGQVAVDQLYSSQPQFGGHKLICIGLNITVIKLNYHPDNEEFIMVKNPQDKFKPLFLIVGLEKYEKLEEKARKNKLTEKDFLALRMEYNRPQTSIFTMLKYTPHCEATLSGKGRHPNFFVTEPTAIQISYLNLSEHELTI